MYYTFIYRWNSRDLRKVIVAILKSWNAEQINKVNYVQSFKLMDKNIEKNDTKMLLIDTKDGDSLLDFLSKNFSQLERINVC